MDFSTLLRIKANRIDLTKTPTKLYKGGELSEAKFSENFISFEDNSIALLKIPLSSAPTYSGVYPHGMIDIQIDEYNPLLAKEIANVANIPCAEYF